METEKVIRTNPTRPGVSPHKLSPRSFPWNALLALGFVACGGGGTMPPQLPNPVPTVTSFSPAFATAGGASFILTVYGTNFVSSSVLQWNGSARTTAPISSTQLTATINMADIASPGNVPVTVFNPAPGGGTSAPVNFPVNNPGQPVISSLKPASAPATGPGFVLALTGANFVSGSVVYFNSNPLTTNFVDIADLTAMVPASAITTAGTFQVKVTNPPPPSAMTSVPVNFTVTALTPVVVATSRLPDTSVGGVYNFGLAASGGAPPYSGWILVNGTTLPIGLGLDATTGRITGASATAATTNFTVQVTDSAATPQNGQRGLSIRVAAAGTLGRNDVCTAGTTAGTTSISNGTLRASISPFGDVDVYNFTVGANAQVSIETFAERLVIPPATTQTSFLDTVMQLADSSCNVIALNDDLSIPTLMNPLIPHITDSKIVVAADPNRFPVPCANQSDPNYPTCLGFDKAPPTSLTAGTYFIIVRDFRGDGRPDFIYELTLTGAN